MSETLSAMTQLADGLPSVCRLGLATRGNTRLEARDVHHAVDRGINYLNWCTHEDGLSEAVRDFDGATRDRVVLASQIYAHNAREAQLELEGYLRALNTDCIDVVTFFYLERREEWNRVTAPKGAMEYLCRARESGKVRLLGVTSHQRDLAAEIAESGVIDLLMVRYNAAHRGAATDVFPTTDRVQLPVVAYTCLRWGALLQATPEDPVEFTPPPVPSWYRFVLAEPSVKVAIMAPNGRRELDENLSIVDDWRALSSDEMDFLRAHGDRVRRHAGRFP